jgi:hypothetical protein
MNPIVQDLRYALRNLTRSPGFTAVVALTLALGIGVSVAVFSLVNAVVLKPLAYPHADRLIAIWATNLQQSKEIDGLRRANDSQSIETISELTFH